MGESVKKDWHCCQSHRRRSQTYQGYICILFNNCNHLGTTRVRKCLQNQIKWTAHPILATWVTLESLWECQLRSRSMSHGIASWPCCTCMIVGKPPNNHGCMYLSRYMFDDKVIVLEFCEPSNDPSVDGSWCFPVCEVCMVG